MLNDGAALSLARNNTKALEDFVENELGNSAWSLKAASLSGLYFVSLSALLSMMNTISSEYAGSGLSSPEANEDMKCLCDGVLRAVVEAMNACLPFAHALTEEIFRKRISSDSAPFAPGDRAFRKNGDSVQHIVDRCLDEMPPYYLLPSFAEEQLAAVFEEKRVLEEQLAAVLKEERVFRSTQQIKECSNTVCRIFESTGRSLAFLSVLLPSIKLEPSISPCDALNRKIADLKSDDRVSFLFGNLAAGHILSQMLETRLGISVVSLLSCVSG